MCVCGIVIIMHVRMPVRIFGMCGIVIDCGPCVCVYVRVCVCVIIAAGMMRKTRRGVTVTL